MTTFLYSFFPLCSFLFRSASSPYIYLLLLLALPLPLPATPTSYMSLSFPPSAPPAAINIKSNSFRHHTVGPSCALGLILFLFYLVSPSPGPYCILCTCLYVCKYTSVCVSILSLVPFPSFFVLLFFLGGSCCDGAGAWFVLVP